ncbi:MAG TPA: ABC transporter permease subunit [Terriglobia bacterium]|nr:ABC transporter permease subunit [Terriglobia bacterium]
MSRLILLSRNAFRGILAARSMYLWVVAILLITVRLLPTLLAPSLLPENVGRGGRGPSREMILERLKEQRPATLAGGLNEWSVLCIAFGILVGAGALSREVNARTIITVLSRPIARWELLFGKWAAVKVFAALSLLLGLMFHLAVASYLDVSFTRFVALGLAQTLVATLLYTGIALALSTVFSAALSGALAVLFAFLPGVVGVMKDYPDTASYYNIVHPLGAVLDYLVPPGYSNLYGLAVEVSPTIDYSAQLQPLLINIVYSLIFFGIGCVLFTRREIKLG